MMANIKACKPTTENRNSICPYDYHELKKTDSIRAKFGNSIMSVPIYSCPVCNRKYTSIKEFTIWQWLEFKKID